MENMENTSERTSRLTTPPRASDYTGVKQELITYIHDLISKYKEASRFQWLSEEVSLIID